MEVISLQESVNEMEVEVEDSNDESFQSLRDEEGEGDDGEDDSMASASTTVVLQTQASCILVINLT